MFMIAGLEGLMLERLDRGETPALDGARELFVASVDRRAVALAQRVSGRIRARCASRPRLTTPCGPPWSWPWPTADRPVKGEHVASAQAIPIKFLENILVDLRQAGIVQSRRGPDGGYWLARPAAEVTVADVIRASDGPLASVRGEKPEDLAYEGVAGELREVWVALRSSMREVLEQVTLADLAERRAARARAGAHARPGRLAAPLSER